MFIILKPKGGKTLNTYKSLTRIDHFTLNVECKILYLSFL